LRARTRLDQGPGAKRVRNAGLGGGAAGELAIEGEGSSSGREAVSEACVFHDQ
jgi:hypothetical protein